MASNLEFVKSASADNVSSLTVTDMFSAQYDVYEVLIRGNGSQNVSSLTAEFLDNTPRNQAKASRHSAKAHLFLRKLQSSRTIRKTRVSPRITQAINNIGKNYRPSKRAALPPRIKFWSSVLKLGCSFTNCTG